MFGVSQALAPDAIIISLPLLMIYEFKGSPFRRFAASGREAQLPLPMRNVPLKKAPWRSGELLIILSL